MNTEVLATIAGLSGVVAKIIEITVKPIFDKFSWDRFWLAYVSLVFGGVLTWFTELNAFPLFQTVLVGRIVTTVVGAVGPGAVYDTLDAVNNRFFVGRSMAAECSERCCS